MSGRRTGRIIHILAVLLPVLTVPVLAQQQGHRQVGGSVTYVTSTVVYGDLGRRNGLQEGDTISVMKNGRPAARIQVTHLASNSFSAVILEKMGTIIRGDSIRASVPRVVVTPRPELLPDTATTADREIPGRPTPIAKSEPPVRMAEEGAILRGRVALQYYALYSSAAAGATFSQPAAVINLTAERLFGAPLRLNYYSNHRYDARSGEQRAGVTRERWRNRFYQFSLQYADAEAPLSATVGRFIPYEIGGVGTVDGAMVSMHRGAWDAGVLAGSQPGYSNSELNFQDQKAAAYVGFRSAFGDSRFRSNLAFAQNYIDGAVDRGYFYLVNVLSLGRTVNVYQNASVDLYDVDDGSGHQRPHLTDLFLSTTWRPLRWWSLTGSYANRRSIYFLRSFASLPDSSFRTGRLQNYQLSTGFNIPGGMFASLTGSLRTQENTDRPATALSARFTWANVFSSRTNAYLLGSYADNVFSSSTSYGIEANRDLFEGLYTALRLRQFRYDYSQGNRTVNRTTVSLDAYYRLSRMFYLSLSLEHYWEGAVTNDRIYSEISMRLR